MIDKETGIEFPILQSDLPDYFGSPYDHDFASNYLTHIDVTEFADVLKGVKGYLDRHDDGRITFYGNFILAGPIKKVLRLIRDRGLAKELKTWDGCYNLRPMKGGKAPSMHGYGLAIDVNAATNPYSEKRLITNMSPGFVQCWLDAGFEWGGSWSYPFDAMHFQLPWNRLERSRFQPKPYVSDMPNPKAEKKPEPITPPAPPEPVVPSVPIPEPVSGGILGAIWKMVSKWVH